MKAILELRIARANDADAPAIRRLHRALCLEERQAGYADHCDDNWIESTEGALYLNRRLAGDGLALIAKVRTQTAGYLLAGFRQSDDKQAAGLESLYVVSDFRRQGVAFAMVKEFLQWFCESDAAHASVAVAAGNGAAAALYRKAGFSEQRAIEQGRTLILTRRRNMG
ncbi:MAG: GNAT family N-acetyltransferase [Tepidisphaeraceae bacterium]|jgi:ribosomal protein S18 acetylase RimI-like enzyme